MLITTNIEELLIQLKFDVKGIGFNYDTLMLEDLKEFLGMEQPETLRVE